MTFNELPFSVYDCFTEDHFGGNVGVIVWNAESLNEMQKINLEECGLNMWELLLGYISIISGKHKILSTLYALRESSSEKSTGQLQPKLWDLRFNEKLIHNYHCILDILVKEILRNADKNCHDAKNLVEKTFEDYFATSMVRKKMGLDKIHPLNARIRNYFERLIGFACRNVNYFEKKIRPNDYTVNSTIYSNIEYQKEIGLKPGDYGIFNTSQLIKCLNILDGDILVDTTKSNGLASKLNIAETNYQYDDNQYALYMLGSIGYDTRNVSINDNKFKLLIKAYQRHYRQSNITGEIDRETIIIIKQHYKDMLT